jgi:Abi-like protein.
MITIENVKSKIEDLKEQKLEFINEEESEKILLREGFYFIDKYKSIFLKNYLVSEEYQDDTKFEYLYYLYYFDNELKSTLFKFILMVENRLKTKLVIFYPDSREEIFNLMFNELKNFIRERKHEDEISKMVDTLKNDFKEEYPNLNLEITPEDLIEILEFIRGFRNICAHQGNLLYSFIKEVEIHNSVFHVFGNIALRYKVFDLLLILKIFLLKQETMLMNFYLYSPLEYLNNIKKYKTIILERMGFPENWKNILKMNNTIEFLDLFQDEKLLNIMKKIFATSINEIRE